jgi:hypothetical protein
VDALRGIAAAAVVGFHFYGGISEAFTRQVFFQPLHWLFAHGNAGVEIFFVISGFVIAYSLRSARITPRFAGLFLVRRSIRLDPPYWATIVLAILVMLAANHFRPERLLPLPSLSQLALHVLYLQHIAGDGSIVEVFWTLCLEVQFYLSFAVLLGMAQSIAGMGRAGTFAGPAPLLGFFGPLTAVSLAIQFQLLASPWPGLMLKFWYLFQLGVLIYWALNGNVPSVWLYAYLALLAGFLGCRFSVECLVGILTGLSIFLAGKLGRLESWLNIAPLQYLGRISYSLYLVHTVVGCPFVYFLRDKFAGPQASPGTLLWLFILACGVSIGVADVFYRFIERSSMRLSKRLKLTPKKGEPEAPGVLVPAAA